MTQEKKRTSIKPDKLGNFLNAVGWDFAELELADVSDRKAAFNAYAIISTMISGLFELKDQSLDFAFLDKIFDEATPRRINPDFSNEDMEERARAEEIYNILRGKIIKSYEKFATLDQSQERGKAAGR